MAEPETITIRVPAWVKGKARGERIEVVVEAPTTILA